MTVGVVRKCQNYHYCQKHHVHSPDTEGFSGVRRSVTPREALKTGVAGGHYGSGFSGSSKKILAFNSCEHSFLNEWLVCVDSSQCLSLWQFMTLSLTPLLSILTFLLVQCSS